MGYPVDLAACYLIEPFGTTAGRAFPHTGDDWARRRVDGKVIAEIPDIRAAFSGTVVAAGWHAQAGWRTVIRYTHGTFGVYGHQAELHVKPGATVAEGQRIGVLGGTGNTSGPHLHYAQYSSLERALSGIVPYWKNSAGTVLWRSVDAWAASFGLNRPDYKAAVKASDPTEDDVALTEREKWTLEQQALRIEQDDLNATRLDELAKRIGLIEQIYELVKPVNARVGTIDGTKTVVDELWRRDVAGLSGAQIDVEALAARLRDGLGADVAAHLAARLAS